MIKINTTYYIILFFLITNLSFSQPREREISNDEINRARKQLLTERIQLSDEKADRVISVLDAHRNKIREIKEERRRLVDEMEANLEASNMDAKLDNLMNLESRIAEEKRNLITNLRTLLTANQIAKTLVLNKQFMHRLRGEVHKRKGDFDGKRRHRNGDRHHRQKRQR